MFYKRDTDHKTRDCPIFLESKKKMTQKKNQPPNPSTAKEIIHTSHWQQASQSSPSHQPSYQHSNTHSEYQSNYQRYPLSYYQSYNYTPHTSQTHPTQLTITYPPSPLQITYPTANSQAVQPKTEPNTLPPPPQLLESSQQNTNFPTFGIIHTITGGSNLDFQNKRQKREYYRQVNHVVVEGPITQTKWSHMPLTFNEADIKLVSFPHIDAMVITTHIDKWDITRVLIDNGSQVEILFLSAFDQMVFDRKQLKKMSKPLYGFSGRRIEPIDSISLLICFGSLHNT
jgi:hypothetical protein